MTEEAPKPALTPKAQAELAARKAREAAALRDNLRRRKEQARPTPETRPKDDEGLPPPAALG